MEGEHLFSARSSETGRRQADTGKAMKMIAIVILILKFRNFCLEYFAKKNVLFLPSPPPRALILPRANP